MISLNGKQAVALYLLLQKHEDELDPNLQLLFHRIQKDLFTTLSIEEMESLEDLYKNKIDVLEKRGYI
jgi:hypothetical protein